MNYIYPPPPCYAVKQLIKKLLRPVYRVLIKALYRPVYQQTEIIRCELHELSRELHELSVQIAVLNSSEYRKTIGIQNRDKVVYTCLTGDYDNLLQHQYINYDYDYICFTDNQKLQDQHICGIWKIRPLEYTEYDDRTNYKWHKTHPHILLPNYKSCIWIDTNIDVKSNYLFSINENRQNSFMRVQKHPDRNCIYEEGKAVVEIARERENIVETTLEFLKQEG
ncbi:MAG: DUF616 domain-containing protein, partial [Prevotellaceae bacterium]|nr:DUF616 domain-containing protein [Prevotellaceae bacterium]